ncbi:hypothetical protein BGW80DRAFT_1352647 [Lactifluus volemus]|nr:hypothetical protein BGW80DRAFT_1352647 [Lactifluus volemus]
MAPGFFLKACLTRGPGNIFDASNALDLCTINLRCCSPIPATALADVRARIATASSSSSSSSPRRPPTLVAVSKYKSTLDISACYEAGQRDFGENYAQELVEKASALPRDTRWHFIGTVQSNKAKMLAGIENLYTVQTLTSIKIADSLNKHRAVEHAPLRVLVQINTSGEEAKGGIAADAEEEIAKIATHVIRDCPRLRLVGLMTIGAAGGGKNDFGVLREARDRLVRVLPDDDGVWGDDEENKDESENVKGSADVGDLGRERRRRMLLLSMGMSADYELAVKAGADIVRVGTSIFGARQSKKDELSVQHT